MPERGQNNTPKRLWNGKLAPPKKLPPVPRMHRRIVPERGGRDILWTKPVAGRLFSEVSHMKVITASKLCAQYKIRGALAKEAIAQLEAEGRIRRANPEGGMPIYTACA
eukprot:TRINITY_DN67972_c8_g5_i1.p1 TRINITY_DN67972_c8_g5~~TRINITY_DN67972_c8_g5_i1.p1  ORF type:complete len:118 (-),score=13.73 TRINITY_DN67972_c8_g5_i1:311-637(-)